MSLSHMSALVVSVVLVWTTAGHADGQIVDVPATIDATGKTEVSTALMRWLAKLPNATKDAPNTVRFAKGGTYWVDYTIILRNKGGGSIPGVMWHDLPEFSLNHWRFDLNGATIEQRTKVPYKKAAQVADPRKRWGNPILATQGATDVQISGGTLRGSCPTATYKPQFEEWTGIRITGNQQVGLVENIVVRNMTIENVFGDYIYIVSATTKGSQLRNVRIENNSMRVAGRQGIVLNGGTNILIKGNTFGPTARFLFDSEPTATQGWSNVVIDGNSGNTGKLGYFQFSGPKFVVAEKLTISNNTLTGGHFKIRLFNGNTETRRSGFTFTNNSGGTNQKNGFGPDAGKKSAHLIDVTRWKDIVITGNTEYFSLINGKPHHRALLLVDVENAKVANNKWVGAIDNR